MKSPLTPDIGLQALISLLKTRSPLGPLTVMAKHIGKFFQIPIPGFQPYVVFGSNSVRKVLVTDREKFLWRNTDPVTELLKQGLLVTDGEEHDRYRKIMERSFQPAALPDYTPMILKHTHRVSSAWKEDETIDMLVESRKIALLIIMEALFSRDVWDDLPNIWSSILKAIQFISPGPWIFWRKIPRPGYTKPLKVLDEYLFNLIETRRNDKSKGNDLLQHLLDAGLDNKVIRDQILTMLIAGHDTSTALLAWTFALLGQHPDIHLQVVKDLEEQSPKFPLLENVIRESLRLFPPIHLGNRLAGEAVEFADGCVPAGERVFYSIYLTHRDPEIWEAADEFRPERFSRERNTPPMSFIPFGGGPRACIGAAFGLYEARVVTARLLQTFTFVPIHPEKIRPHMGATLEPHPGVYMRAYQKPVNSNLEDPKALAVYK